MKVRRFKTWIKPNKWGRYAIRLDVMGALLCISLFAVNLTITSQYLMPLMSTYIASQHMMSLSVLFVFCNFFSFLSTDFCTASLKLE